MNTKKVRCGNQLRAGIIQSCKVSKKRREQSHAIYMFRPQASMALWFVPHEVVPIYAAISRGLRTIISKPFPNSSITIMDRGVQFLIACPTCLKSTKNVLWF